MKDILTAINQARYISIMCNLRAEALKEKARKIKRSNNVKVWINNMNKRDALNNAAEMLQNRADKVWSSVIAFQGKYINWKNLHEVNGQTYCGILELLNGSYQHPSAQKYSIS